MPERLRGELLMIMGGVYQGLVGAKPPMSPGGNKKFSAMPAHAGNKLTAA